MSEPTYEPRSAPEPEHDYSPLRPQRGPLDMLKRLAAPLLVLGALLLKFAGSLKFLGIFVSVGGYALIWGWTFAVGFVALILVHEVGHYVEAKRQGLSPSLPVFIPFLGAYVAIKDAPFDPWRNALVSLAGPIAGGIGALGAFLAGEALDSRLLLALAYAGFFLNLINLVPVGFLDGGFVLRSLRVLRRGAGDVSPERARRRGQIVAAVYGLLIGALAIGMLAAHVPQDRL
jgi:Zn-dependent protease